MKSSEILREAARLVERGENEYGCLAIDDVICLNARIGYFSSAHEAMASKAIEWLRMLEPERKAMCGGYWNYTVKGPRIIGLCLAAAIAESEGD